MRAVIEQFQSCINGAFEFTHQLTPRTYWRALMFSFFATAIVLALSFGLYYFYLSYLGVDQPTNVYSMVDYFAFGNSLFESFLNCHTGWGF